MRHHAGKRLSARRKRSIIFKDCRIYLFCDRRSQLKTCKRTGSGDQILEIRMTPGFQTQGESKVLQVVSGTRVTC